MSRGAIAISLGATALGMAVGSAFGWIGLVVGMVAGFSVSMPIARRVQPPV